MQQCRPGAEGPLQFAWVNWLEEGDVARKDCEREKESPARWRLVVAHQRIARPQRDFVILPRGQKRAEAATGQASRAEYAESP